MSDGVSLDSITDFKKYLENDFRPAYTEIAGLENRVHIQKLLYISLLNRFDSALDDFFKLNSNLDFDGLSSAINDFLETPVTTSMLIDSIKGGMEFIEDRRRSVIMSVVSRKKHVDKARLMLKAIGIEEKDLNSKRVNNSTGRILNNFKPQSFNAPASIIGFIDWQYCRRNVLVHSGGRSKFEPDVIDRFKNTYKVTLNNIRLSYGALSIADTFYSGLLSEIEKAHKN